MDDSRPETTDEMVDRLGERAEAEERRRMVQGFQDHSDAFLLAGALAALTGVVGRAVKAWRRRRRVP